MAQVLHHSRAGGATKLILVGIANHQGDGGAYPKVETLARYGGVSPRQAQRCIKRLVETGELVVHLQDGGGRKVPDHLRPNRYEVVVRCPSWCDRSQEHRDTRPKAERIDVFGGPTLADLDPDDLDDVIHRGDTSVTPSGVVGGDTSDTPPVTPVSPLNRPKNLNPPTPPHDTRPCQDCGQDQARCQAIQRSWSEADRHDYKPTPTTTARASRPPAPNTRRQRA